MLAGSHQWWQGQQIFFSRDEGGQI